MSEAISEGLDNGLVDEKQQQKRDLGRLKAVAFQHGAVATAILLLWGSAEDWSQESGGLLISVIAIASGFFGGTALAFLSHEWGHFSGARLSGAASPVLKERKSFFMFNFKTAVNSRAQFLAMSIGGPFANWLLVVLVLLALPSGSLAHAGLLATVAGVAVNVCVFEFPVISRVSYGSDPAETVAARLKETADNGIGQNYGMMVGIVLFTVLGFLG
jgi:hypothetical protein